ncbi:hypothetical protein E3P99_00510 [Wallemia hederae]|uniref:Maltose/galactoside acetyltransferase domain-containing protein n=1 Tax=Wallemia hederae TaxID=1540922 RepID=A0A4V4LU43_9BASI|nr:hypothetical protein E3P99_00510 [Wallemia hederae]
MPLTPAEFHAKLKREYTSANFQRALNGEPYKSLEDTDMVEVKKRARQLMHKYNVQLPPVEYRSGMSSVHNLPEIYGTDEHYATLSALFNKPVEECKRLCIEDVRVDHGVFTYFEGYFYANYGLVILDCSAVWIGDGCSFGPSVHLYSAGHSTDVEERKRDVQRANPITIGRNCWLGGHVSVIAPCTIGDGVTVAAGAVVRGNIPPNVVVAGNPAKIIKHLTGPQVLA